MTCHEFTLATRQALQDAGISFADAEEMVSDAERMDDMHGELLSPAQAAVELMVDAHIGALAELHA